MTTSKHDELLRAATDAIERVHADATVDQEQTLASLDGLKEYIEELMTALRSDINGSDA